MFNSVTTYVHNGKEYPVNIVKKHMRSIRYVYRRGEFYISAPYLTSMNRIMMGLDKFADKLIKADVNAKARGNDFIYLLGDRVNLSESGEIHFTDGQIINYKNQEDLDKKLKKWFLKYIENRHRYYEGVMNIKKPYKISVKKMSTRYGSNSSQTHRISYSLILMHYTSDVIDSVIVHELAHDKVRNHSNKFYNVVYEYCPDYDRLDRKLKKGIFHD